MATANIKAVITADDRASKVISGVGHGIGTLGKVAGIAAVTGIAALGAGAVLAVNAFMEQEKVMKQTEAVIKSTGGAAGISASEISTMAASLQKVTTFGDEAIQSGQNLLLTFTNIGKDIFPEATETMLDMSEALGQDVKSSAIQLGKALQDPILGVTALRRVGINFSEDQQDVIKNLVNTGRTAEAQKLILKELQVEFGGSAVAARETLGGSLKALQNSFGDLMELFGGAIAKVLNPLIKKFDEWTESMGGVEGIFDSLKNSWRLLTTGDFNGGIFGLTEDHPFIIALLTLHDILNTLWNEILQPFIGWVQQNIPKVMEAARLAFEFLRPALEELWTAVQNELFPALKQLWRDVLEPLIPVLGVLLVASIYGAIAALRIIVGVASFVITAFSNVVRFFTVDIPNAIKGLIDFFMTLPERIGYVIGFIVGRFYSLAFVEVPNAIFAIINFFSQLPARLPGIIAGLWGAVSGAFNGFRDNSNNWAKNLIDGIINWFQKLPERIAGIINSIGDRIRNGIGSGFQAAISGRAEGGPVTAKTPYIVGEKGPELFVPNGGGTIIPNNKTGGGGNVTVNINVGLMTGSAIERREAAMKMFEDLKVIAGQRGQSVSQMIGAA